MGSGLFDKHQNQIRLHFAYALFVFSAKTPRISAEFFKKDLLISLHLAVKVSFNSPDHLHAQIDFQLAGGKIG